MTISPYQIACAITIIALVVDCDASRTLVRLKNRIHRSLSVLRAGSDDSDANPITIREINISRAKSILQFVSAGYAVWAGQIIFRSSEDNRVDYELYDRLFKANLKAGMEVLEVGYGDGENLGFYPAGTSLVGIDPHFSSKPKTEDALAKERAKMAKNNKNSQLKTLTGGVCEALPFDSESFDAVVSTKVLCAVSDPVKSVKEIARVLKPGGVYICVEHILADDDGVDVLPISNDNDDTAVAHLTDKRTAIDAGPTVRSDVILSTQQKLFDPLQVKLADGCHLNRRTDLLLRDSVGDGKPFREIIQLKYADFGSQWPISRQIFVSMRK